MESKGSVGGGTPEAGNLREYVEVLRRRKWIVVQAVLLVPIAAVLLSLRGEARYSASAEVLLSRQNLALTLAGTADPLVAQEPERLAETQAQLAMVPDIVRRITRQARTGETPDDFLKRASVVPRPNTDLLIFTIVDGVPGSAAALANTWAREYTRYRRELDTRALTRAGREVRDEIARLEARGLQESQLYATLVEREQQLRTIEALQNNASVVREATGATQISPRPKRNAVLGLGLGLVLGIALAFLWEALDTRVRRTEEIDRVLELPLLARLPRPPSHVARNRRLVMLEYPRSTEAEAYRILRTNFEFFNVERGARTVMVTSSVGQEGKSTTIANLAVALAAAGQRVVLVDLDLRRPTLSQMFGLEGKMGVTDLVHGRAQLRPVDLDAVDQADGRGSLEVLTSGPLPENAGDFVGSSELAAILEELRARADIVLVDAPPVLPVGDAMQLSTKVDAVLVVVRLNVVRRQMLNELRRFLDACPADGLGYVVTGAELEPDYRYVYASYPYYARSVGRRRR